MFLSPMLVLLIGVAIVILLIVVVRVNAFLALIAAAFVVSLLSPGRSLGLSRSLGRRRARSAS